MSLQRNLLRLSVSPCSNDSIQSSGANIKCASKQEIIDFISKIQFMLAFINSYFDQDDFEDPIKTQVVIQFYNAIEGQAYNAYLNLQKIFLNSYNSWLSTLFDKKEYDYLSIEFIRSIQGTIKPGVWEMFNILIFCHKEEKVIERLSINLVDIMTILGGFINILSLLTKIISKMFSKQVFYWQLITEMFHFDDTQQKYNSKFNNLPSRDQNTNRDQYCMVKFMKYNTIYSDNQNKEKNLSFGQTRDKDVGKVVKSLWKKKERNISQLIIDDIMALQLSQSKNLTTKQPDNPKEQAKKSKLKIPKKVRVKQQKDIISVEKFDSQKDIIDELNYPKLKPFNNESFQSTRNLLLNSMNLDDNRLTNQSAINLKQYVIVKKAKPKHKLFGIEKINKKST
ncbi:UNKNOWN [Stylonychia lemnae]|uniref:Uncharacterized protein n=1 Tax=Stylonychia lemnae TaxID=5949 RepID=A0A078B478_STYLE|nr:UNKNOWN [Stylonychia lemnae]|eukprot:CDW89335.1 UNKNOWN [Stylonychia lemnae]